MSNPQEFSKALTNMITTLRTRYLDPLPQAPGVPTPSVGVASLTERTVGIGNWRGAQTSSGIGPVGLMGGRIDAVVRFQVWAKQPEEADQTAQTLSQQLLIDREDLRKEGFLRLSLQTRTAPEPQLISGASLWKDSAEFQVLYEYAFDSSDGEGLLARVPVAIDGDLGESTTISDDMVRWDDQAANPLVVRGRTNVGRLSVLDFAAGVSPTGPVGFVRTRDGATGLPVNHASLSDFLAAVAGDAPSQNHTQFIFASWSNFLASFQANPRPVVLGGDTYTPRALEIDPQIVLSDPLDRFEIHYQDAAFDHAAVAYLRVKRE